MDERWSAFAGDRPDQAARYWGSALGYLIRIIIIIITDPFYHPHHIRFYIYVNNSYFSSVPLSPFCVLTTHSHHLNIFHQHTRIFSICPTNLPLGDPTETISCTSTYYSYINTHISSHARTIQTTTTGQ